MLWHHREPPGAVLPAPHALDCVLRKGNQSNCLEKQGRIRVLCDEAFSHIALPRAKSMHQPRESAVFFSKHKQTSVVVRHHFWLYFRGSCKRIKKRKKEEKRREVFVFKAVFLRETSAGAPRLLLRIGTQQQTAGRSGAAVYSVLSHTGGFLGRSFLPILLFPKPD